MIVLGLSDAPVQQKASGMDLITHLPQQVQSYMGGLWSAIREPFAGAWQRNISAPLTDVITHATAWTCITMIAFDIAKMQLRLLKTTSDGINEETENPAYSPVLRRPNHYQNRIQFYQSWLISKLTRGNTYVLKERDGRRVVVGLYVLDPARVQVLVAPDGAVFYQLGQDNLSGIAGGGVTVPASEIIHDIYIAPYHPLCGVSPIVACGMAVAQGLRILQNSSLLFENGSQPGGVLTAPNAISATTAERIQKYWDTNFAGQSNIGKVAVLGDGLKYEPMAMTAVDSQLIEQLKWGDEKICGCYHVPSYMANVGPPPNYNNIEALNQQYYSQCLQIHVETLALCLDEGLELKRPHRIEFDLDGLIRMDSATKMKTATDGVKGSVLTVNNARKGFNLKPLPGGDTVYMQQQNYSLTALARRDAEAPAPASPTPGGPPAPASEAPGGADDARAFASFQRALLSKAADMAVENAMVAPRAA